MGRLTSLDGNVWKHVRVTSARDKPGQLLQIKLVSRPPEG